MLLDNTTEVIEPRWITQCPIFFVISFDVGKLNLSCKRWKCKSYPSVGQFSATSAGWVQSIFYLVVYVRSTTRPSFGCAPIRSAIPQFRSTSAGSLSKTWPFNGVLNDRNLKADWSFCSYPINENGQNWIFFCLLEEIPVITGTSIN